MRTLARSASLGLVILASAACQTASPIETTPDTKPPTLSIPRFEPPPRRAHDIVELLRTYPAASGTADRARLTAEPAPGLGHAELAAFYRARGEAARLLGRPQQLLADLHRALDAATAADSALAPTHHRAIMRQLAFAEAEIGNYRNALAVIQRPIPGQKFSVANSVMAGELHARLGDVKEARRWIEKAQADTEYQRRRPMRGAPGEISPSQEPLAEAILLEAEGRWSEAEPYLRKTIALLGSHRTRTPVQRLVIAQRRFGLAENLLRQGRGPEAEVEARATLSELLALVGKHTIDTADALRVLSLIVSRQNRADEAETLARIGVEILDAIGAPDDAPALAGGRQALAKILAAQSRWADAAETLERARRGLGDGFLQDRLYNHDLDVTVILWKAGKPDAASAALRTAEERLQRVFGPGHPETVQASALRAILLAVRGQRRNAADIFRVIAPQILEQARQASAQSVFDWRLISILEGYLEFLVPDTGAGESAALEAFRVADALGARTVGRAINAHAARAAIRDPALAALARQEGDLAQQMSALSEMINDLLSATPAQQQPATVVDLRKRLSELSASRRDAAAEIRRRFPAYADLVNPPLPTAAAVIRALGPDESLVTIYTTDARTYVWALRAGVAPAFVVASLGRAQLGERVERLRRPMSSSAQTLDDVAPFDLGLAHELYGLLLRPLERVWKPASHVVVALHGPMSLIPVGILTTAPFSPTKTAVRFAEYRAAPWLARSHAISVVPSAQTLIALGTLAAGGRTRLPFIGFGDPFFTERHARSADTPRVDVAMATRDLQIAMRAASTPSTATAAGLDMLSRLPETAGELRRIARALGADPARDVHVGRAANEHAVKTLDLSNRRVIVFATHALVPGDLDGLDQPALALTAPQISGLPGDGLLTMAEVLGLKLDADWIVLSACNTAAASGAGAEAVSGLGRAFFYAGARALLVSHWPVETLSAQRLTTGIFERQSAAPALTRSEALQRTIAGLIERDGIMRNGRLVVSYAHPLFWAPFVLVGNGGR